MSKTQYYFLCSAMIWAGAMVELSQSRLADQLHPILTPWPVGGMSFYRCPCRIGGLHAQPVHAYDRTILLAGPPMKQGGLTADTAPH